MCSYHANFIEAVAALHSVVPSLPSYENGFVRQFLCEESTLDCWFGQCGQCSGISIDKLKEAVAETSLSSNASWKVWKKSVETKRIEKHEEKGNLSHLIAHLVAISPHFFKHSFIKREQAEMFNLHDLPRASNIIEFREEALIQVDFAENFVCEAQDEVQSAHWNQRQLTLFTSALYHNELFRSKAFVSNNLTHTKESIVPYMYRLLSELPKTVKVLKVWSDGPSSQFKNKYMAVMVQHLETKLGIKIIWNYFATSHGKGCVDGIGATVKTVVRKHIKARDCSVNSAADFMKAFKLTPSKILVEEVTDEEFEQINDDLGSVAVFAGAKNIRDIYSAHQIQVIDGKIVTFKTSKLGYN